jgi:hypothetical protein
MRDQATVTDSGFPRLMMDGHFVDIHSTLARLAWPSAEAPATPQLRNSARTFATPCMVHTMQADTTPLV